MCDYNYFIYGMRLDDDSFIFLLLYVDDMLIISNHLHDVNKLKNHVEKGVWHERLGVAKKILGLEIHKDMISRKLWLLENLYLKGARQVWHE